MEELFKPRCYSKSELARLYFPELDAKAGVQKMRRWIQQCKPLKRELEDVDYDLLRKELTVKEVRLIVRHLGEP